MRRHLSTILLVIVLLVGFSLLLYPTVSDWWNSSHQSRVVAEYSQLVEEMNAGAYDGLWAEARAYNASLPDTDNRFFMSDAQRAEYDRLLNVGGNGVMGVVEVPKLELRLPLYHGTGETVLQVALGHIEGSSLPTGGPGTHCVISGHRGLPSAKLFTNLDRMEIGDVFMLHVLNETLTYEVDQILTVLPEEIDALEIDPEQDYCTLVTCTPYGINTHRLLVRGHRIANAEEKTPAVITADAVAVERWQVGAAVAAPLLAVWFIASMLSGGRGRRRRGE